MTTHTSTRRHGWISAATLAATVLLSGQSPAHAQSVKCPNQSIQWTTSWTYSTCSAMTGEASSGTTVYIYDKTAPETGWAGLRCNNGTWEKPNSYECKGGTPTGGTSGSGGGTASGSGSGTPATPVVPVFVAPAQVPADIAAARLLEQATFGPTAADIALVKSLGATAWINQQIAMAATPIVPGDAGSVDPVRQRWFVAMATAPDQLRQRMIFALSQIMVVSSNKNPYANEITPWLKTLDKHAFGKFGDLLREMTINPAMGKYLALGHSKAPSPNEDFAREVMQLFTIGLHELNMDGSFKLDGAGKRIPTYNQTTISEMARALSGWGFANSYEDMSAPLVARESYHDKGAKTIVRGIQLPAGQTAQQDMNAVMTALLQHPNLAPFISVRLIRHFVTSNPSPAYIQRVATVFKNTDGDLAAVVKAILLDTEARLDQPATNSGHLKDPMLHTLSLVRALGGKVVDPKNILWDYFLMGERLAQAPSVFSFYSPLTALPDNPGFVGPEFQIYSGSHAVRRANFVLALLNGEMSGSMTIDITPYVTAAKDPQALMALVNTNLLQNRMSESSRQAIGTAVFNISDMKQRALTALYLTAITAEFAVQR